MRDRIRQRREELGMSQDELARRLGYKDRSTIAKIEAGVNDLNQTKIAAFAAALETTTYWLMGDDTEDILRRAAIDAVLMRDFEELPEEQKLQALASYVVRIPVLGLVPAGIPIEAIEDIVDWEEIPSTMCSGGREYFGLRVKGDSMYPEYMEGDTIIVRKTPAFDSGDVCVVYVNGYDATLKRVEVGNDGAWTLVPRNPEYPPKTYTPEDIQTVPVSIAGVVVELRRKVRW